MSLAQSQALIGTPVVSRRCIRRSAQRARIVPRAEFELAPPPYPMDALEPEMSKNTFDFHWGKHHRAYVTNLNGQIKGTPMESKTLEEIIVESYNGGDPTPVFNNAAQSWNHAFFWDSMKPGGGGDPSGDLAAAIDRDLGGLDKFKADFSAAGATQFGSGWAWLVSDSDGKLSIVKTPNAVNPMALGCGTAILTMDVWEHAYYLDYQNARPSFIETFVTKLINWEKVAERYADAQK